MRAVYVAVASIVSGKDGTKMTFALEISMQEELENKQIISLAIAWYVIQ